MRLVLIFIAALTIAVSALIGWIGENRVEGNAASPALPRTLEGLTATAEARPDDAQIWKTLAKAHRNAGQTDQAVAAYVRAARLDPDDREVMRALLDLSGPR